MSRRRTLLQCASLVVLALIFATVVAPESQTASATGGMAQLAAGGAQTCGLTADGGLQCWGDNGSGELGAATTETCAVGLTTHIACSSTPVDVTGLASGVVAVSMGDLHTCAVTETGGLKCWGGNYDGQVGDGTTGNHHKTPVSVSGLSSGVAAVTTGDAHTCALTTAGGVKCWGSNDDGRLGDGTTVDRVAPGDVPGLASGVVAVAAGAYHTCALTAAGGVKCWGSNAYGQLGDGTTTGRLTPVDVSGMTSGVTAVAADQLRTCALTTAGGVKCWGENGVGQLGDGTTVDRAAPVDVSGLAEGVADLAMGGYHTCALTVGGGIKCWGLNAAGQLGDGTTLNRAAPGDVSSLNTGVADVVAGLEHTCAAMTSGRVKCWGGNDLGQLADGTATVRTTPVDVVDHTLRGVPSSLPIPDGDPTGVGESWTVDGNGTIGDLNVYLDISHSWVGDLTVTLTHVDTGTNAVLIDRPAYPVLNLGCDGDDIDAVLDDEVSPVLEDECDTSTPTIDGDFSPNEPLSVFDGESVSGTWMLHVSDIQGGDSGKLNAWWLYVVESGAKPTATPTNTPTPTAPAPPTDTPPEPPTATSPAPPTATQPPPPGGLIGDVSCDGTINAIDAAFLLQFGAGLIASLPCDENADSSGDGTINAIDAALILQFSAELVSTLPP